MALFQKSVLAKHLKGLDENRINTQYETFKKYFLNPEIQDNIRESKEEQFQATFLTELFVKILGYTLNPDPNFNLTTEYKNVKDAKKADGAILQNGKAVAVIELKGTNTTDLDKIESQAFGYKNNQPDAVYVITSNFEKIRFYIDNAVDFEEFNLFHLSLERFKILYLCLAKDNIFIHLPKQIKDTSLEAEENITKNLYKDYSTFKQALFNNIVKLNPEFDKLLLFKKTQKLLDRFLFIFFSEDGGLLPPNSIREIINQWVKLRDELDAYTPLYNRFKKYFGYMNTGHKGKNHDIFAYNGGLFEDDAVLDNIKIDDTILYIHTQKLSAYDFKSEVDVNILGHIFEHSLNEIEEVAAEIEGQTIDKSKTKRKKDGVFYTPKYITKYIVENTVGKLCEEKKAELNIDENEYNKDRKRRKKDTLKHLTQQLTEYRNWLLNLTICDPACGSGAFLNQALDFLITEHAYIDELETKLLGGSFLFPNVENAILENNLYGVDINEESVDIAKLSLWLRTAKPNRKLNSLNNNIKCGNSLIDDPNVAGDKAFDWKNEFPKVFENGGFDVVIGNPPYVQSHSISNFEKDYFYKKYKTAEYQINTYGLFVERILEIIKDEMLYSIIIPNYWLSTQYDEILRNKTFLENQILTLLNTYEVFESATVDTLIIVGKKGLGTFPKKSNIISISKSLKSINQRLEAISLKKWFFDNDLIFNSIKDDVNVSFDIQFNLMGSYQLKDFFKMYQGMKPYEKGKGNPPQTRKMMENKVYHAEIQLDNTYEPLLKARNIKRYFKDGESGFIKYGENLAAARNPNIFKGERVLINRILSKSKIDGFFTEDYIINNSDIFNLIPISNQEISCKALYPIIVSKLCATYFKKRNVNLSRNAFPKINVNTLSSFPIPKISISKQLELEIFSEKMLQLHHKKYNKENRFQKRLTDNLNIEKLSKKLETFYEYDFKTFLLELNKQKVVLKLTEQDEWEDYFKAYKTEINGLQSEIERIDKEIDALVYELYGLTEEEIKIVENS